VIDWLWGLLSTPGGEVSFTAGPNDEQDGLIGAIVVDTTGTAKK
jgi:hypothetical protein